MEHAGIVERTVDSEDSDAAALRRAAIEAVSQRPLFLVQFYPSPVFSLGGVFEIFYQRVAPGVEKHPAFLGSGVQYIVQRKKFLLL